MAFRYDSAAASKSPLAWACCAEAKRDSNCEGPCENAGPSKTQHVKQPRTTLSLIGCTQSPVKLQCCLHLSRRPCLVDRPKSTSHECVRAVEISAIESVEHIQAELESYAFFDREILLNTQVKVSVTWCAKIGEVSRSISQAPWRGDCEGRRVEPLSACLICNVVVTYDIHMLSCAEVIDSIS